MATLFKTLKSEAKKEVDQPNMSVLPKDEELIAEEKLKPELIREK